MSISAPPDAETGVKVYFREAIIRALREEMDRDPRVFLMGQDIGCYGGAYKETAGLFDRFGPERVRDTPVAEASLVGLAVGAAAAGFRPVGWITYMDFLMLGLDPLVNYGAKLRYKTGGQLTAPLVLKTTAGAQGQGVAHSQCLEAWLIGVPGLKVVAPSTPADAYGLLKSAIRDDGPVVFVDHKRLFPTTGYLPPEEELVAFGRAAVRREGTTVTIATFSAMTRVALAAADQLIRSGISCEVIDLRTLAPLDIDTLSESVRKTGFLLTLEEGQVVCGVGAELAFRARERVPEARVARLGSRAIPVSSSPALESYAIPDAARVVDAIRLLLGDAGAVVESAP